MILNSCRTSGCIRLACTCLRATCTPVGSTLCVYSRLDYLGALQCLMLSREPNGAINLMESGCLSGRWIRPEVGSSCARIGIRLARVGELPRHITDRGNVFMHLGNSRIVVQDCTSDAD